MLASPIFCGNYKIYPIQMSVFKTGAGKEGLRE